MTLIGKIGIECLIKCMHSDILTKTSVRPRAISPKIFDSLNHTSETEVLVSKSFKSRNMQFCVSGDQLGAKYFNKAS